MTKAYKTTDDAKHQMMCGQSIPRAFFINQTLTEMKTEEEEVAGGGEGGDEELGLTTVSKRPTIVGV